MFGDNAQGFFHCLLLCYGTTKIRHAVIRRMRICCYCCGSCINQRSLSDNRWVLLRPIVRASEASVGQRGANSKRSVDVSDLDVSRISLEMPTVEECEYQAMSLDESEDEVVFDK